MSTGGPPKLSRSHVRTVTTGQRAACETGPMKNLLALAALVLVGGCATTPNDIALGICEQSPNCTVTDNTPLYGPPQQQAVEQDRRREMPPLPKR